MSEKHEVTVDWHENGQPKEKIDITNLVNAFVQSANERAMSQKERLIIDAITPTLLRYGWTKDSSMLQDIQTLRSRLNEVSAEHVVLLTKVEEFREKVRVLTNIASPQAKPIFNEFLNLVNLLFGKDGV